MKMLMLACWSALKRVLEPTITPHPFPDRPPLESQVLWVFENEVRERKYCSKPVKLVCRKVVRLTGATADKPRGYGGRRIYVHNTQYCGLAKCDLVCKCHPLDGSEGVRILRTQPGRDLATHKYITSRRRWINGWIQELECRVVTHHT